MFFCFVLFCARLLRFCHLVFDSIHTPDNDHFSGSAGSYSGTGSVSCTPCAKGKHSATAGLTICESCPEGFDSYKQSANCTICKRNYFLSPDSSQCEACPDNAWCDGGTLLPIPDPGYFVDRDKLKFCDTVMRCPLGKKACDAGRNDNAAHCWSLGNFSNQSACSTDLVCTSGYAGPLCNPKPYP